jgi:hypothetical protein
MLRRRQVVVVVIDRDAGATASGRVESERVDVRRTDGVIRRLGSSRERIVDDRISDLCMVNLTMLFLGGAGGRQPTVDDETARWRCCRLT